MTEPVLKAENIFDVLKSLAEASVVFAAALFLIGWSYTYGYYRGFGLSVDALGLPVDTVLIHSIPVFEAKAFWITALRTAILLILVTSTGRGVWILSHSLSLALLVALAGWAASRYAIKVGLDNARRDSYVATSTLPYVELDGTPDDGLRCTLHESNYRLLLLSTRQVFVVLPIDDSVTGSGGSNLRVCSFPESRITAIRIQVGVSPR